MSSCRLQGHREPRIAENGRAHQLIEEGAIYHGNWMHRVSLMMEVRQFWNALLSSMMSVLVRNQRSRAAAHIG
jgi:hypothetical protein